MWFLYYLVVGYYTVAIPLTGYALWELSKTAAEPKKDQQPPEIELSRFRHSPEVEE